MRKPHGYVGQVCQGCRKCSPRAYPGAYLENRRIRQRAEATPDRRLRAAETRSAICDRLSRFSAHSRRASARSESVKARCSSAWAAYTSGVAVKRIKPNILSEDESRAFYNDVIGLDGGDGLDWILFFGTDQPEVQLSVMKRDIKASAILFPTGAA